MRIIHTADLHIDSKMQTHLSKEKASERKKELILTFERMVEYAKTHDVDAIIIAGDMFDSSRVSIKSKERIFNLIRENSNIEFFYLSGNHDEDNVLNELEENYSNLKVFKDDWTSFLLKDVCITGIKNQSSNKFVYDTLNLEENKFNIVVMHGQISKYNTKDNSEKVNLSKLKNKNIDYLALGHIHSFEIDKLDSRGVYCYSGCLEGRGFDECGEKGFVLLDINNNKLNYEFIPFAKRTLREVIFDISNLDDWFKIERKIVEMVQLLPKGDLIKVVLNGKFSLNLEKQIEHLGIKLNELFYFARVKDESSLEINMEDFKNDVSLKGEFIREVLKSELKEEEKERVIIIGLKALNGEDLN